MPKRMQTMTTIHHLMWMKAIDSLERESCGTSSKKRLQQGRKMGLRSLLRGTRYCGRNTVFSALLVPS
jgi:hypothetical protein